MKMKRLLCIVNELNYGGAETFLMKVYRCIDKAKYQFDFIVTENTNGIYEDEVRKLGGRVFEIPYRTKNPVKAFLALKDIVRKNRYFYVLKLSDTPIGIFDILSVRIGGAGWVSVRSCNSSSDASLLKQIIYIAIRPVFCSLTDQMIAPSLGAARYTFGKKNLDQVTIIHNGIDTTQFSYTREQSLQIRKKLGIEKKKVYGHIGRFNKQKNHVFLIEIFKEIIHIEKESVLLLVGYGELRDKIKSYVRTLGVEEKVIFYGTTNDVPSVLSVFDAMLFPSLYEGLPNVVIEAQCVGVPCLISDTITREVKVTPLVHYCSLDFTAKYWADRAMKLISRKKSNRTYKKMMSEAGYDIEDVRSLFISSTFNES